MADLAKSLLLERARKLQGRPAGPPLIRPFSPRIPEGWRGTVTPPPAPGPKEDLTKFGRPAPEEWNYENPPGGLGPRGEKLPAGAVGWTPYGEPYYGDGLKGWWKETQSRLLADIDKPDEIVPKEGAWWQKALGTAGNVGKALYNIGGPEGGKATPLTMAPRVAGEVVRAGLELLGEPAKKTKQLLGAGMALEEAGEGSPLPDWDITAPNFMSDEWQKRVEAQSNLFPVMLGYNALRTLTSPKDIKKKWADIESGYQAGRVLYSSLVDPQVRAEFMRDYKQGHNPYLLAMELENPLAEMGGELIMDPLNLVGLGARRVAEGGKIASAFDEFYKVPDALKDVLKTGDALDDLQAAGRLQDFARAQQAASAAKRAGLTRLAERTGLTALTSTGKQAVVGRRSGELAQWIFRNAENEDQAGEVLKSLLLMADPENVDQIAEGISIARKFADPRPLFSEAGQELGIVLRNMLTDEEGVVKADKFLEKVKSLENVDDAVKFVSEKMDSVVRDMFPSITEKIEKGKKLIASGDPELVRQGRKMISDIPAWTRGISRFDKAAQATVYKPLNSFFAGIYMGLSPGYAIRNMLTNTMHVLVDEGPAALRSWKPSTWRSATQEWLGGAVPKALAGFGGGTAGVDTAKVAKRMPFTRLAEKFEEMGAAQVVGRTVEREMSKMLKPGRAIPDIRPLIDAGMPEGTARYLVQTILESKGDIGKAVKSIRAGMKAGSVDSFRSLVWLGANEQKQIKDFGIFDEVLRAIQNGESKEDTIARLRSIRSHLAGAAAGSGDEVIQVDRTSEALPVIAALSESDTLGDDGIRFITNFYEANAQSNGGYWVAASSAYHEAARQVANDPQKAQALRALIGKHIDYFNGIPGAKMKEASEAFTADVWRWNERIAAAPDGTDWAKIWRDIGIEGEPPPRLGKSELKDALWSQHYHPKQRQLWNEYRDSTAQYVERMIGEFQQVTGQPVAQPFLDRARQKLELARRWDQYAGRWQYQKQLKDALSRGDNATAAAILANKYKIASITEAGFEKAPLDKKILNIINANLEEGAEKYGSLSDVPPDVADLALAKHVTKDIVGATPAPERIAAQIEQAIPAADVPEVIRPAAAAVPETTAAKLEGLRPVIDRIGRGEGLDQEQNRQVYDFLMKYSTDFERQQIKTLETQMGRMQSLTRMSAKQKKEAAALQERYAGWLRAVLERNLGGTDYYTYVSRNELPEAVSLAIQNAAADLASQLGAGGVRKAHLPGETTAMVRVSENPEWYKQLYKQGITNKNSLLKALDRIIAGDDTYKVGDKYLLTAKNEVMAYLLGDYGIPGDPAVLSYFNRRDDAARALKQWLATPEYSMNATDEDILKLVGGDQGVLDDLLGRMDELDQEVREAAQPWTDEEVDALWGGGNKEDRIADILAGSGQNFGGVYGRQTLEKAGLTEGDIQYLLDNNLLKEQMFDGEPSVLLDDTYLKKIVEKRRGGAPPPPTSAGVPTLTRVLSEQDQGLNDLFTRLEQGVNENWGRTEAISSNPDLDRALSAFEKEGRRRIAEARLLATSTADAARDFTMLSYGQKRVYDLALAYVFPYHFWYTRTYNNWLRRIVTNPEVIAGYAKYREALEKLHAGAPEWWKYNINTNELLGQDSDNPLFFNLEATLNPLNGLTGIDFNDKAKRVNFWTALLDDLGKMGPSTWTPFSLATAAALYMQGEEEAAARWGGRLLPQTATIKSLTHLMNVGPAGGLELDPMVQFFSRGTDPYERRRVGRALGMLVERGDLDPATALEAARTQEGEAWDMAKSLAADQRAAGQLASFALGVGFKSRTASDLSIDRFYEDYYNLLALESTMKPEEYREAMDELRSDYPFMDTVLLARKGGDARDRAYAYNVIGRIPPGQKNDIADAAGIDPRLLDRFWQDKGHIEKWPETDRDRFMAGIVDIGALLDMPDDATKAEWREASKRYSTLTNNMVEIFGSDIQQLIDRYYQLKEEDRERANAFLDAVPQVAEAMDYKDGMLIGDPVLSKYYVSLDKIEGYYTGVMYDALEVQLGEDIWDKWDEYYALKAEDPKAAKAYWKSHKELAKYIDLRGGYERTIAREITAAAKMLPDRPELALRTVQPGSLGQEDVYASLQAQQEPSPYEYTWEDWQTELSPSLRNLVLDSFYTGDKLPDSAYSQVERLAEELGIEPSVAIQLMQESLAYAQ